MKFLITFVSNIAIWAVMFYVLVSRLGYPEWPVNISVWSTLVVYLFVVKPLNDYIDKD